MAKDEITELQTEFQEEREELSSRVRELSIRLELAGKILDNFVPYEEQIKIQNRAVWDEETEEFYIGKYSSKYFIPFR